MPALSHRRTFVWVAALYVAQGLPYGVTSKIWPVWFRTAGVSLTEIGLMALLALPWSWKPLWAPLVDRFGTRRVWIAPSLLLLAAISLSAAAAETSDLEPGLDRRSLQLKGKAQPTDVVVLRI